MMKDAIETAIKMETDAIAFYGEAANKTSHAFRKRDVQGFYKGRDQTPENAAGFV